MNLPEYHRGNYNQSHNGQRKLSGTACTRPPLQGRFDRQVHQIQKHTERWTAVIPFLGIIVKGENTEGIKVGSGSGSSIDSCTRYTFESFALFTALLLLLT